MKKIYYLIICILIIFTTGCNKTNEKITIDKKYYNTGEFINVSNDKLSTLDKENYILYSYNSYCAFQVPCEDVFKEFMSKYKIDFLSISFKEFKKNKFYKKIKYAPSIIIIKKGNIVAYLDPNSDDDIDKYQDANKLEEWIKEYVEISNNE